ncbi:MAG TPA: hypothetical protein VNF07_07870 [Acidimicrobiales bacterium]|nr:hypothetical protein [Acidimicrobiales bacterium]
MGILDTLLGRSKTVRPNLDHLFGLPGAQVTLEVTEGLLPTGQAGVCFKPASGEGFVATEEELRQMLSPEVSPAGDGASTELAGETDEFGYRWVVIGAPEFSNLVTHVHYVNSTLEEHGYGSQLLCSVFGFAKKAPDGTPAPASIYLVYLYKRGAFYPFVPTGPERRDNEAELRLKVELESDLVLEADLDRWFPLWKLPVH